MILGHYATALVPHQRLPRVPVWIFLLAANLADFLWLAFATAGLERPYPTSLFEATFSSLAVEMTYSHDIVPSLGLAVAAALLAYGLAAWKGKAPPGQAPATAGWCAALVLVHEGCDLIAGFRHHVLGPATSEVGLGLYRSAPELALVLEAALGAGCVLWFQRARAAEGNPLPRATTLTLYALFVLGTLVWLPLARTPLRHLVGF